MRPILLLLNFAVLALARNVINDYDELELKWPKKYHIKAIRTSLTDGVVENYESWKTKKRSRVDYNNGHVKSFVRSDKYNSYRYGIKYTITPEANMKQETEMVCTGTPGEVHDRPTPESILPDELDYYVETGKEMIDDKNCAIFTYNSTDDGVDARRTLWAVEKDDFWVPVRYEVVEFNTWRGSKDKYEVWDFFDFQSSFSFNTVFYFDKSNCTVEDATEMRLKHVLFFEPEKKHIDVVFTAHKEKFKWSYANADDHALRKNIFKKNLRHITQHNRRQSGYKMAINQFTDKTPEEMNKYKGLKRRPQGKTGNIAFPYNENKINEIAKDLPAEYDLRLLGLVTSVKNQEECGSCWTFGTTAAVEGALARVNGGTLMSLSNQAIIDCAWPYGADGCDGGSDNAAYEWMIDHGLPTVAEYGPYTNKDGPCRILNMTTTYTIKGFTDVTPNSIGALKVALINHGPLSVSVDASSAFAAYSSGIFYDPECDATELNHEVTLVGYGERDGDTFWIIKNSWGPTWGIDGYMFISARDNNCGIATEPTYVVV